MKRPLFAIILLACLAPGCGSMRSEGDEEVLFQKKQKQEDSEEERVVTRVELQEDLQRFSGVFIDRISQASFAVEERTNEDLDFLLLRQLVLYTSSAIEIASGQTAEVNLLDMSTFIDLCKDRVEKYWIPKVYGEAGRPLLEAFMKSEQDLLKIARKVSSPEQILKFEKIVDDWKNKNPDLILVERVRLSEVAEVAGVAEQERSKKLEGLLPSVKGALSAADQSLLLANRAMFLANHFPDLVRLQGRLGAQQILSDSLKTLSHTQDTLAQMQQEVDPLVGDLTVLAKQAGMSAKQVENLLKLYVENFPPKKNGNSLETIDGIVSKLNSMVGQVSQQADSAEEIVIGARKQVNGIIWTSVFALLVLGGGFALAWWGGYYLAKKKLKEGAS